MRHVTEDSEAVVHFFQLRRSTFHQMRQICKTNRRSCAERCIQFTYMDLATGDIYKCSEPVGKADHSRIEYSA